ncbi:MULTISPECIES: DUF1955 domain-containing protein [Metallosphaera]|uniref:DUF1955 domain-containing protein n=1 Tax=Metallosphaera TaxID=41980 RepID=UPI001F068363|nr:DUF1955 domain-containing protein [Metallosphaera sedula]MCH1770206.1 DUF1955 domain-containing protein [Metallosphaera sedula]MCP6727960.1 DUF1955 domain-containing protein [Metallosphaera sedula]
MVTESRELVKSLMEAKESIISGDVKRGVEIIEKTVNSSNIKEANWVICNVIDAADCAYVVETLNAIGKIFDVTACGNLKRVISCFMRAGKDSEFVDLALSALVQKRREDQLDKILAEAGEIPAPLLLKLASAYGKIGNRKKEQELLKQACEKGLKEACRDINQIFPRIT